MKNKIINTILIIASILATSLAIAAAVLNCPHALVLLIIPTASAIYFSVKAIISARKVRLSKKSN